MFLVWCENNPDVVEFRRCEDSISYEKPSGGIAYYHPDFRIEIDGKATVVEVKGGRSELDLVERKRQAAVRFYDDLANYVMIYKSDLKRMGIEWE